MKASFQSVSEVAKRFLRYIDEHLENNTSKPLEALEISKKYAIDASSSYVFDIDAQSFDKNSEFRKMFQKLINFNPIKFLLLKIHASIPVFGKFIEFKFTSRVVETFFTNLMKQAIKQRKKRKNICNDFLTYMTNLRNKKNVSDFEMTSHGLSFLVGRLD